MTADVDRKTVFNPVPREHPTVVAYGIAHAGAGAAAWRTVAQLLPEHIEVRGIRLPGRENRIKVPFHTDMDSAAAEVAAVVEADDRGLPVVLIGSCFGALVATAASARVPVAGLVGVRQPAPAQIAAGGRRPVKMNAADLRQWLLDYKLTPPALLADEAFEFYEPTLRADLNVIEDYVAPDGSLHCPVHLVHCPFTTEEPDLAHWGRVTSGPVTLRRLDVPGDPLTEHAEILAATLEEILSSAH